MITAEPGNKDSCPLLDSLGAPVRPAPSGIAGERGAVAPHMHSRPLRGGCGVGMITPIPCAPGGPWKGDIVEFIPLKPNSTTL
ncbi:hypothetical protein [Nitrosomonas sp. Is37]|uniref:hypothetical protein n=1 Tax=Nitrosomonas sp. Is37 TaxID=3080535 RepID=UPI00294AE16D|nr:hypothetical protein [Nitrosomonas sp. Is37]MDV6345727.1 hypothetical protein [Nitrosomonas sp. Is37]